MEKAEFIAKAKETGMADSLIREFLEYYSDLENEGKAFPLEDFFKGALTADEVDMTFA